MGGTDFFLDLSMNEITKLGGKENKQMSLKKELTQHQIYRKSFALSGNFPAKAMFWGFAGLDFTAGELPFQGHGHISVSLGRQYPAVLFNDGAGDMEVVFAHVKFS